MNLDPIHVLLVEDEPDSRETLAILLGRRGAEVVAVGTCAEAMAALRDRIPHVLVSDIALPDGDQRIAAPTSPRFSMKELTLTVRSPVERR